MSLQYSEFEPSQQNKEKPKPKNRNQTLKNRKREKSVKVQNFLDAIDDNDDDAGLYDFNKQTRYNDYTPQFSGNNAKERHNTNSKNNSLPIDNVTNNNSHYQQNIHNGNDGINGNGNSSNGNDVNDDNDDNEVTRESFNNLQSEYSNDYYKQFVPYYNQLANSQEVSGQKDMLLEKLNYMIHLLEEQQEEKTGHITEELILYTFLGVFVIFIVDSFARAGKYVR